MREADDVSNSNSREDKLPKDILTEEDVQDLLDETINQEKASIASLWKSKRGWENWRTLSVGDLEYHEHGKKIKLGIDLEF